MGPIKKHRASALLGLLGSFSQPKASTVSSSSTSLTSQSLSPVSLESPVLLSYCFKLFQSFGGILGGKTCRATPCPPFWTS